MNSVSNDATQQHTEEQSGYGRDNVPACEIKLQPVFNSKFGQWTIRHTEWCHKGETSAVAQVLTSLNAERDAVVAKLICDRFNAPSIRLRPTEIQSGFDRVRWAEGLIRQLPADHDGRNSWLLNYAGEKHEADKR